MPSNEKICVIVPCHNEGGCIGKVLDDLASALPGATLLVVDDASDDDSSGIASGRGAVALRLPVNLGIGGAVQTGLKYAVRNGFRYAVKFDGDGQHLASELPALLKPVLAGEADLSIGSRFLGEVEGFKSTFARRIGIWIFRLVNSLLIGKLVTDNTSGLRAYGPAALDFAARHYPSFDYPEPEEVVLMGRNGFEIVEIPVEMAPRLAGSSSINFKRSVYFMGKVLLAVFMTAMRPRIRKAGGKA